MLEALKYFFSLGCFGFGGPFAAVATMQRDLVEKRKWISEEEFTKAFAILKGLPGPISCQMIIFLSIRRAGRLAGLLSAIVFILPAFILMIFLAEAQSSLLGSVWLAPVMLGFQAGALALIAWSFRSLTLPYWREPMHWLLAGATLIAATKTKLPEPVFIVGAGLTTLVFDVYRARRARVGELGTLFWICFKAGALVFGSGLAIIPLMQQDFISHLGVTQDQFLNALAFGQITPGPVMIAATYLGYISHGFSGALVATLAIFLASTFHMITWFPVFFRRYGNNSFLNSFTRGAIAAVCGFILLFVVRSLQASDLTNLLLVVVLVGLVPYMPAWLLVPLGGIARALIFSLQ